MQRLELIKLADRVLTTDSNSEEFISLLESYLQGFQSWFTRFEQGQEQASEAELMILNQKHAELLSMAESLMDKTRDGLKELKLKSKGLKSYIDTLPRRISRTSTKKG